MLVSANCKNVDAAKGYLECILYAIGVVEGTMERGEIGTASTVYQYSLDGIHLTKISNEILCKSRRTPEQVEMGYTWYIDYAQLLAEVFEDTPMNLRVWNSTLQSYSNTIAEYMENPDTADWEELEKSINIYLSE